VYLVGFTIEIYYDARSYRRQCLSPLGSVKGTLREGSLSVNPEGYLEKALGAGICLHRGSAFGEPGEGLVYRGF
jgi:hypothetical protein